jgi:poly(3-hydroxyoctanoate) depolymerase
MAGHTARIIAPQVVGYLYQLFAGWGWTSIHWLHKLKQPTLVLGGSDDPLVPLANARILSLLIPNNRLFIVPGGGHLFLLYSIDKVAPVIRDFLNSADPISSQVQ